MASDLPFQFSPRLSVIMQDFYTACRTGDDKLAAAIIADLERQHCDLEDFLATLGGGGGGLVVEDLAGWIYTPSASYDTTTSRAWLTNGDFYEAGSAFAPDTYLLEGLELDFGFQLHALGFVLALVDPADTRTLHKNNSVISTEDQFGNGFGGIDAATGTPGLNGVGVYFQMNGDSSPSGIGLIPPYSTAADISTLFDDYGAATSNWFALDKGAHVKVEGGMLTVSVSGAAILSTDISGYGLPGSVKIGFTQAYGPIFGTFRDKSHIFNLSGNVF